MEMSHRATVVPGGGGPLSRTFWLKPQGSLSDFASQEGSQEALSGSACISAAGLGLYYLIGYSSWEVMPYAWHGQLPGQLSLLFFLGKAVTSDAWPQNGQLLVLFLRATRGPDCSFHPLGHGSCILDPALCS